MGIYKMHYAKIVLRNAFTKKALRATITLAENAAWKGADMTFGGQAPAGNQRISAEWN
jgi:hypothetical protein